MGSADCEVACQPQPETASASLVHNAENDDPPIWLLLQQPRTGARLPIRGFSPHFPGKSVICRNPVTDLYQHLGPPMPDAPKTIATACSYPELLDGLRARAASLKISREMVDQIAGLTAEHASKLLAPVPLRRLGLTSLGLILGAWVAGLRLSRIRKRSKRSPAV